MRFKHYMYALRDTWLLDILCLTVLFLVFYTLWLGSYPLFTPDEGRYSEVAREMIVSGDYITPRVNGVAFLDKPVMYYWLQALAISLFGIKEWALRLFPSLISIFGCLITYLCGRHLFNRRTGLLSAIILATSPLYFGGGHYANLDLEVAVFISCTLLFFITAMQSKGKAQYYWLLGAYVFAAIAFLTKGLIGIVFPCLIGGAWMMLLHRFDLFKKIFTFVGVALFLALTLPWYLLEQQANPGFMHYFFVTQQITRFLSAAEFNNPTPFWFYIPIVLVGFFPWVTFLIQAIRNSVRNILNNRAGHAVELYLLLWLSIIFIFFSIPHSKTVSYILPIFPALALLVGYYLSQIWETALQEKIYWAVAFFIGLNILFISLLLLTLIYNLLPLSPSFAPYVSIMAAVFALSTISSLIIVGKKKTLLALFSLYTLSSVIFLLTLTLGAASLNQNSVKPLVTELKTLLHPQDEVINYFKFYQDLPLYLEQQITLVANWNAADIAQKDNWVRELWYGMPFQNTDAWIINEDTFWQRFNSEKRVFVFLNTNYFNQFKSSARHFFILGKYNDIILLSNKPTILSKYP